MKEYIKEAYTKIRRANAFKYYIKDGFWYKDGDKWKGCRDGKGTMLKTLENNIGKNIYGNIKYEKD